MIAKRVSLISLGLALLLGTSAAVLAQRWVSQRVTAAQQQGTGTVAQVVVAAREIQFGKRVDASHLRTMDWPAQAVPDGAFHDAAQVIGKVSKYDIFPGEPVLQARIADPERSPLLASLVTLNKRAVTVRVDDVVGVGGFLMPGSHVDVVASRRLESDQYQTRTVLHDLRVLAVDQTATPGTGEKPVVVRAVTLETDPREAEILVQATREGSVQLALRNPEDHTVPAIVQARAPSKPVVVSRPSERTVIRGTHVNTDSN